MYKKLAVSMFAVAVLFVTSAVSMVLADDNDDDSYDIIDPGPPPVNIYHRGFVENWKEVIFPISLRKNGTTKAKET